MKKVATFVLSLIMIISGMFSCEIKNVGRKSNSFILFLY